MNLTTDQYHERFDQRRIDEMLNSLDAQPPSTVRTMLSELSFQLAKALDERDEARACLRDVIEEFTMVGKPPYDHYVAPCMATECMTRLRKAAGLNEGDGE